MHVAVLKLNMQTAAKPREEYASVADVVQPTSDGFRQVFFRAVPEPE